MAKAAAVDVDRELNGDLACIAGRYLVEEQLGKGGMGAVYRVFDKSTGRTVALKQLAKERSAPGSQFLELFQREYHTLVQLAHPLVIEVYDYGVDEGNPYYTMELLGGNDLRAMAPMKWKKACALLRDVASSLAIVHSRRLVHRDVTPRNVRCTEEGRAKLMDFGAMVPMGPVKRVVGTPPFVPPEALNGQPLDGRADLFSLGALAYWLISGRNAYGARKMEELRDAWRSRLIDLSAIVPELPPSLSSLVMSLLNLDRLARPVNAAEVIDRLTAIAGLPAIESVAVSQAYLTTPNLVGRARQVTRCRRQVLSGVRSSGATLLIRAASGMGRSRLLMACMLDAKIAGATVLSATAADAAEGDYGVVRALVEDLLEAMPDATLAVARDFKNTLGHVVPELHGRLGSPDLNPLADSMLLRSRVQSAVVDFFTSLAAARPLLVAVDDIHRCDERSATVLAALSREIRRLPFVLVATLETGVDAGPASKAVEMLEEVGAQIVLRGLSARETEQLMISVFGNVPNAKALADWAYRLSEGNPRTCMELAQHLVDQGIARYEAGQWVLPDALQDHVLPRSLKQALDASIQKLSQPARVLAETLSLATHRTAHKLRECVALWQEDDQQGVFAALDELVAAQVLVGTGNSYRFRQAGLVRALHRGLGDERRHEGHARLARACESEGCSSPWVLIHHLQKAGQGERALRLLLSEVQGVGAAVGAYELQVECCETALALAASLGVSPREIYFVHKALLLLSSRHDPRLLRHAPAAEEQLCQDSGRVFWEQSEGLEPGQRIGRCLEMAQARWESLPEAQRGFNPLEAVQELAVYAVFAVSAAARAQDTGTLARLPGLVAPFRTIVPAIDVLAKILDGSRDAMRGQRVAARYMEVEESLSRPVSGMTDVVRTRTQHIICYYLALDAAYVGDTASALERAEKLEAHPSFVTNAWQIRMLAHLGNGNAEEAEWCRTRFELLAMQNPEGDPHLVSGLSYEASLLMLCGDLMGLKRLLLSIGRLAEQFPGWAALFHLVGGEVHRLRGELARAQTELQKALEQTAPGHHFVWARAVPNLVQALIDLGAFERARDMALNALEQCQKHKLHPVAIWDLQRVLTLAEAKLGRHAEASARVDALIEKAREREWGPVRLGNLYEARARVAIEAQDEDGFAKYAQLTAEQYRPGRSPALVARYERLMAEASRSDLTLDTEVEAAMSRTDDIVSTAGTTGTLLPDN